MDDELGDFARTFSRFLESVTRSAEGERTELNPLGRAVQEFLGVDPAGVDTVREEFAPHEVVDLDRVLADVVRENHGARHGIRGPYRSQVEALEEFFTHHFPFRLGPPSYHRTATGPDTTARVVALGLVLVVIDGVPVVWLQRGPNPRYGQDAYILEVLCPDPSVAETLMASVRKRMAAGSVLRGQVVSFAPNPFDPRGGGAVTYLRRPEVGVEQVVLPAGVLDRIRRHVVGIGEQRDLLTKSGQHLKRGLLLYGPPGTGKTHVIRHLLSVTPGVTAVLLSGRTLPLLPEAAKLARSAQPAIVVMEDCDLVAEHRGGATNAALFETLEAMDGLDGDADVTFILTTNRVDLLERALAERPGRVDLAVAIDRPDVEARRRLVTLYAERLLAAGSLSPAAVAEVAERTEGVTASFTKELIRRAVLAAATLGRDPTDEDLLAATEEMLSDAEALTRTLLGAGSPAAGGPDRPEDEPGDAPDDDPEDDSTDAEPGLAPRGGTHWSSYRLD